MKTEKYVWKCIDNDYWCSETFDTVEECIEEARQEGIKGKIEIVIAIPYKPYICADNILEEIEDEIYLDYNSGFEFIRDKKVDELSRRLTDVLQEWLEETNQQLDCYEIDEKSKKVIRIE